MSIRDIVRAMRVHQWLKNLLVFVPALTAHCLWDGAVFRRVALAFFSFSLCASAGYLVNDILDLKADRRHPVKRNRPFASGSLSPIFGMAVAALLCLTAMAFGTRVSSRYAWLLCGYLLLSIAYSLFLKTLLVLDVFLLAFFYTSRIVLGGEAAHVHVSFWLAAFSVFLFFSLALLKRFVELKLLLQRAARPSSRHDYRPEDLPLLGMWGAASGCAAVVVLALYINSADVTRLYRQPIFLWPVCLAFLFWLTRIWMLANRDELPYDPIIFAMRDPQSYAVAAFLASAFYLAL